MGDYDHSRNRTDSEVALRKIFIGGLSYGTDDDKLRKYFGVYGSVQDAVVMKDPVSRRSRGFGFITFSDISAVDNALAHEPHTIDARKVEAKRAVPRSEVSRDTGGPKTGVPVKPNVAGVGSSTGSSGAPGIGMASPSQTQIQNESRHAMDARISMDEYAYNKIFVGGLHYDTRDAEFRSYFERFGRVMSAEVMFNRETHKSRGFGFIVFELEKGAEQVCAEKEHVIDGKVVEVKRAIPRSRIGNNGAILPPSVAPTRPAGMGPGTGAGLGHPSPARPETPSASTATAVKPHTASAPPTVPGSKLRQDMRRSASMGSSMMSTVKPAARPSQQSLAASIAAIGVPSPRTKQGSTAVASPVVSVAVPVSRVAAGASYAAALRTGATSDDSETSITDQMLIASLQSDLLQVQSSNSSSLYGGLFTDSHAHPTSSVIERPPRSLSEPVIQLPNKMSADYFKSQLSLIQGRGGVAALGGAFNPVSPLLTSFGSISPLQKAIRSPVMTALASPLIPLPSLGLAWLSTSPAKASDSLIPDVPQLSPSASASATASASSDLFQPLPPSNTMMMPAGQIGQQQMLSRQQDFQQLQYMQQQFLQQQMQQMQQQQAYYQSQGLGLFNQTLINQQQMSMQMLNGQQQQQQTLGVYPAQVAGQGMQGQVQGTESVPSPLAWASMVTSPQQTQGQQQQQQQYFEPLLQPQAFQQGQGFYTTQQPMNQQQYYQQQQYHLQMQQHLQATGQYSMGAMGMVLPPGGISFNTPVQQQFMGTPYMTQADGSQPQAQTQAQTVIQGVALNGTATSPTAANGGGGIGGNSLGLGVGVGTISSSSTVPRTSLQLEGSVAVVGTYENGSVSLGDGTSSAVGKDDLFLYEGLRLDGDAPEFEPQATRGW